MTVRARLRQWIGPDPELIEERDDLASQVDALAIERDDLIERLASADQRAADLRRNVAQAYEPERVGDCRKIRHIDRYAAEQHAIAVASRAPGDTFNVYRCKACPAYPGFNVPPWHVGHCPPGKKGSMMVVSEVLYHACGCAYGMRSGAVLAVCPNHDGTADVAS